MFRKYTDALLDDAVKLYEQGFRLFEIAKILNVHPDPLSKHLRSRKGVKTIDSRTRYRKPHNFKELPIDEMLILYRDGFSVKQLAERYKVARGVIHKRLIQNNITPRNRSDAMYNRMQFATDEEIKKLTEKAHNACRGMTHAREDRINAALKRQESFSAVHIGPGENEFFEKLYNAGINCVRQAAIDVYNVDFLCGHVAVEITFSRSRNYASKKDIHRLKTILEAGKTLLQLNAGCIESLIQSTDYIISQINILQRDPTTIGQYWMIRCRFQEYTVFRNNLGQMASIKVPKQLVNTIKRMDFS